MWALLRATHLGPSVAVTAFATLLALTAGRGAGTVWVTAAVLAGQFSIGWANDWLDAERDRVTGRRDKPVVTGLEVATVRRAALLALAATVPLSLASGLLAGIVHVTAVALGWVYDLGAKGTVLSPLPYAGAFGLLPVFVALGLPAGEAGPWWSPVAGGLLGAGAHFLNALPDLDDDAATGVRGLPQRLGATRSVLAGALLLGAGVLVVGLAPAGGLGVVRVVGLLAGLACVAGAVGAALRGRPRRAFQFAIGAAATVVVTLLAAGTRLS